MPLLFYLRNTRHDHNIFTDLTLGWCWHRALTVLQIIFNPVLIMLNSACSSVELSLHFSSWHSLLTLWSPLSAQMLTGILLAGARFSAQSWLRCWLGHTLDQSETSIPVTWPLMTNQRPVFRSRDPGAGAGVNRRRVAANWRQILANHGWGGGGAGPGAVSRDIVVTWWLNVENKKKRFD